MFAYPHSFGVSVTGGFVIAAVVRRALRACTSSATTKRGAYGGLKEDEENGRVAAVRELGEVPEHLASFGVDEQGEIYVVGYEGTIFHLDLSESKFE